MAVRQTVVAAESASVEALATRKKRPTMNRMLIAERAAAVVCLLVALYVGVFAGDLVSTSNFSRPGAFPAWGALVMAAIVLGSASAAWVYQAFRRREAVEVPDLGRFREALVSFAILMVGAYTIQWLGLLAASGLTYLALLVYFRDRNWIFMAVSTIGYLLVIYYGLGQALRVPLPTSTFLPGPW